MKKSFLVVSIWLSFFMMVWAAVGLLEGRGPASHFAISLFLASISFAWSMVSIINSSKYAFQSAEEIEYVKEQTRNEWEKIRRYSQIIGDSEVVRLLMEAKNDYIKNEVNYKTTPFLWMKHWLEAYDAHHGTTIGKEIQEWIAKTPPTEFIRKTE